MGLMGKLFGKKNNEKSTMPMNIDVTPDYPNPFGYKTTWYAIKGETPQTVIEKLDLDILCEANWKSSLDHVRKSDDVFVSPVLGDYVLVIDLIGITKDADHDMVKAHARLFGELFYFGSHTVADYYAWAKFKNGDLIRAYAYIGNGDDLFWNEGSITPEELNLGFDKFPVSEDSYDEDDIITPEEESVIDIARAWSIDPSFDGANYEKSTGYICKFK